MSKEMRHTFSSVNQIIVHIAWAAILLTPLPIAAQQIRDKTGRKPVNPAPSYHFASGTSALGIPFQLSSNFVLIQLRVNSSRPLWFLFSTGSTSFIDTRIAKKLGLAVRRKEKSTATASSDESELMSGVSLAL